MLFEMYNAVSSLWMVTTLVLNKTETPKHYNEDPFLRLTPMIRAGKIHEARDACRVIALSENDVESYSGYLTVDKVHNSNLFFWFFPAINGAADAPVLLWLQGGPGGPSMYGLFEEHGPYYVSENSGTLERRNCTWASTHSMLYVDNPVGTGFSFTEDDAGYSNDQTTIGRNMYKALLQFFTLFPEYRKNDFYITGESYAGKYVPAVSYIIHQNNPGASIKINLKGLVIGNGVVDPEYQGIVHSENLYQRGFIDDNGKSEIEKLERLFSDRIKSGDFREAFNIKMKLKSNDDSLINQLVEVPTPYNSLINQQWIPITFRSWTNYLNYSTVRTALHVGNQLMNYGPKVYIHLEDDIPRSVSPWLSALLDDGRYRVLLYSGQFDLVVPYSGTVKMARSLRWSGARRFKNATRTIWRVRGSKEGTTDVAGYATSFGPLTMLLVRNAGHMVPIDQPERAYEMIVRFTSGKSFQ